MILFSTQNFLPDVGGTQAYVTGLADALAANGHAVEIYCNTASKGAARRVDEARAYRIIRFGGPKPIMRLRKARAVTKRLAQGGVKAIVTDTWKSLQHLHALEGVRVLCLAHGSELLQAPGSAKGKLMSACFAKADVIAANSHFTAALVKPFVSGKTRVQVLLPGVAPPPGARAHNASGEARILTIARLEPRKGIDIVLQALPALVRPGLRYDIVGKGDDKSRLVALAAKLGVSAHVAFHDFLSEAEKAGLLASADVFALPNRREPGSVEGFGIVFLEAAAFGVPSIAGADGGTADAVLDGKTGLIVDGGDVQAVQGALARLLRDTALHDAMGEAARARFWNEFSWDKAVTRFETAIFG